MPRGRIRVCVRDQDGNLVARHRFQSQDEAFRFMEGYRVVGHEVEMKPPESRRHRGDRYYNRAPARSCC